MCHFSKIVVIRITFFFEYFFHITMLLREGHTWRNFTLIEYDINIILGNADILYAVGIFEALRIASVVKLSADKVRY